MIEHPIDATVHYVLDTYQGGIFHFDLADILRERYAKTYSSDYPLSAYVEVCNRLAKSGFRVVTNE